jgi:hypothetical protein
MVRPLENQERLSQNEYVNRIRQADRGHGAAARDFAYEIRELSDEERHERHQPREFGEDTYEHESGEAGTAPPETPPPASLPHLPPASDDDSNLDITV